MKGKESLLLKWGTVKGWNFEPKSKAFKSFREFAKGMSASCMADRPDAKRRKTLCAVIDKLDGTIENDWTGKTMTKEEAKKYIMEYDAS